MKAQHRQLSINAKREIIIRCAQAMAAATGIPLDRALDIIQDVLRFGERQLFENCASRWGVTIPRDIEAG